MDRCIYIDVWIIVLWIIDIYVWSFEVGHVFDCGEKNNGDDFESGRE